MLSGGNSEGGSLGRELAPPQVARILVHRFGLTKPYGTRQYCGDSFPERHP